MFGIHFKSRQYIVVVEENFQEWSKYLDEEEIDWHRDNDLPAYMDISGYQCWNLNGKCYAFYFPDRDVRTINQDYLLLDIESNDYIGEIDYDD